MKIKMSLKLTMIFILLMFATLAYAWSDNICTTQGWSVRHDMKLLGDSATFLVENISGETAFKVTCLVYFYDSSDNYLGRSKYFERGPIHQQFSFQIDVPKGTSKIRAEIFNTWDYAE